MQVFPQVPAKAPLPSSSGLAISGSVREEEEEVRKLKSVQHGLNQLCLLNILIGNTNDTVVTEPASEFTAGRYVKFTCFKISWRQ